MNRPNAHVVEANIPAAQPCTQQSFGRQKRTVAQMRESADLADWMDEQDEFEVRELIHSMANKDRRAWRRHMAGH